MHEVRTTSWLGAVGSAILGSHFGASLEDHGPNVVLYRAGPQTARRAGSLMGHDHSRQSSSRPKSLRRPPLSTAARHVARSKPLTATLTATGADVSALQRTSADVQFGSDLQNPR